MERERRGGEARRVTGTQLNRGVHGAPASLLLLAGAARSACCLMVTSDIVLTALPGRELLTWLVALPQKHQNQHRHTGLTSCSAPWLDSVEPLEFLLLLKADMLQGQTEFNQKSSGALQSSVPREGLQDGSAHFLAWFRRAGAPPNVLKVSDLARPKGRRRRFIGLKSSRSSLLPPHLCPGVREKHSSRERDTALQEEKWEEEEGGGEVRQQWVEALSLSLSLDRPLALSAKAGTAGD